MSTSESEYVALAEVVKEVAYLRQVEMFIKPCMVPYSVEIREDNQGAIKMAKNPIISKRTKHIDIKHHFIRDMVEAKRVHITYINTVHQHADVHTKPLEKKAFLRHIGALMGS